MDTPKLEGTWQPIHAELNGESAPDMALKAMRMVLSDDRYKVEFGKEISDEGSFTRTVREERIDLTLLGIHGVNAGRIIPAIAQLRGNRLRVCYGLDGQLPEEFSAGAGSSRYLVMYRRE